MAGDTRRIRRRMDFDFPLSGDFAISNCDGLSVTWLCPIGTPVRAAANGKVVSISPSSIDILHYDNYVSRYFGLADIAVIDGRIVNVGEIIGHTGKEFNGLKFVILKDYSAIDPLPLLRDITEFHDPITSAKYYTTKTIVITGDPFIPIYDMVSPQRRIIGTLERGCVIRIIATVVDENHFSWIQIGHDQWIFTKDGIGTIT